MIADSSTAPALSPCDMNPCFHNGTCLLLETGRRFTCRCTDLHAGIDCERPNTCWSKPCQNNATCNSSWTVDRYSDCRCPTWFNAGLDCDRMENALPVVPTDDVIEDAVLVSEVDPPRDHFESRDHVESRGLQKQKRPSSTDLKKNADGLLRTFVYVESTYVRCYENKEAAYTPDTIVNYAELRIEKCIFFCRMRNRTYAGLKVRVLG